MAFGPKPWKDKPDGTTPVTAAAMIDLETRLSDYTDAEVAALLGTLQVVEVNALPGSPVDGQQVDYYPSGTIGTGVCWRCTWRDALNGGAGAWTVQGPPLVALSEGADRATASTSFVSIAGMPSITIPVAGLWRLEWGAIWTHTVVGGWAILAVSPTTDNAAARDQAAAAGSYQRMVRRRGASVSLTAGALTLVARTVSGTVTFRDIDISAHPVELRP